jgi:hypothetical protein
MTTGGFAPSARLNLSRVPGNSSAEVHEMTLILMLLAFVSIALGGILRDRKRRAD